MDDLTRPGPAPKAPAEARPGRAPKGTTESTPAADRFRCRICGNARENRPFSATEMMLGIRERFDYFECGDCGALQIAEIPADLGRFYGRGYYSFDAPYRAPAARRWLKRRLARHVLGPSDAVGALVAALWRRPPELHWVRRAGLGLDASILDVGAGAGQTLLTLWDYGFRRLLGCDPFLDRDLDHGDGVRVVRAEAGDLRDRFDLVMFHHSFEHVPDPHASLADARDRLGAGGTILIRMPVASEGWRRYGPAWVHLDAPRHLHVHTVRSLEILAGRAGLRIHALEYDTTGFELWASEQYRRGIPLSDPRSHAPGGEGAVFSRDEMAAFERQAAELNRTGRAGQAAFWLRAVQSPRSSSSSHSAKRGIPSSTGVDGS